MKDKEILFRYRKKQSEETLRDAEIMLNKGGSPRSVINRLYYALFYSIMSLFLNCDITIRTSKHTGIIGVFDKEFIITGKFAKKYSKILHSLFDDRQELDYKELVEVSKEDAIISLKKAKDFISAINKYVENI